MLVIDYIKFWAEFLSWIERQNLNPFLLSNFDISPNFINFVESFNFQSKTILVVAIFDFRLLNLYLQISRLARESRSAFFLSQLTIISGRLNEIHTLSV